MSQRRANRKSRKNKDEPEEKEEQSVEAPDLDSLRSGATSRHFFVTTDEPYYVAEMIDFLMHVRGVKFVKATGADMESAIEMAKAELNIEAAEQSVDAVRKVAMRVFGHDPG